MQRQAMLAHHHCRWGSSRVILQSKPCIIKHRVCHASPEEPSAGAPATSTSTADVIATTHPILPPTAPKSTDSIPTTATSQHAPTAPATSSQSGPQPASTDSRALSSSGGSTSSNRAVRGWLNQPVPMPAGYRTTRRELLKFASLAGAAGCFYVAATRSKAMSFASPQALINALMPPPAPESLDGGDRVAAFKRYIADLERRGGGREVPDFPRGADWLNSAPLTLTGPPTSRGSLAGRVVLLDFWTYCCINCIHALPDLAELETQFASAPVAVVGVHSAKFDNEKDSSAIRAAVLRYDISHPVVNDRGMAVWAALGVSSWPTLAVVSPGGKLIAMLSGEGHRQDLEDLITAALQYYGETGQLDGSTPLPLALERNKTPPESAVASPLRYPGKIASDLSSGRLFVSDSNNHRIVITDLNGRFIEQIGGNGPALRDGSFETAAFNRPQGLVFSPRRNQLFVADTENHAVRCCDLTSNTVITLAGNGSKGRDYRGGRGGSAQPLNSPWDVELDARQDYLYIALAGQHQIWDLELSSGTAALFSGTGAERNQNGPTPFTTSWAQPSGLSLAGDGSGLMYVADSESSTIRVLDLGSGGSGLKVGGDPLFSDNLFRFGDKDGFGAEALLQHPLAVLSSADGSAIYVADSYNHRIKALNPNTNEIVTLAGSGAAGFRDGVGTAAQFSEPAGLCRGPNGTILIADTNNSAVRILDPKTQRVSTLGLTGVPDPRVDPLAAIAAGATVPGLAVPAGFQLVRTLQPLAVGPSGSSLTVTVGLPPGYHLTAGASSSYYCQVLAAAPGADATATVVRPASGQLPDSVAPSVTLSVSPAAAPRAQSPPGGYDRLLLRVLAKVYYCQQNDVCLFEQICFEVPLEVAGTAAPAAGPTAVALKYDIAPPAAQPAFILQ